MLVHPHDAIREHLMNNAGMVKPDLKPPLEHLRLSEWSPEFEKLMRNRLIMGALRYGSLGEIGKPMYDRLTSIERRIQLYRETGNTEHLVDIANLAMVEFVEGTHPLKHWESVDDGEHAKVPIS